MSKLAIQVEQLGKHYQINHELHNNYPSFRQNIINLGRSCMDTLKAPFIKKCDSTATQEQFWALRNLNFQLFPGERLGILGRNGAGKSTLLKILSRITEPSEGKITIRGNLVSMLEIGAGFHVELTGRENIYLNGAILGMSRSDICRKFDEIVAFADVEKFLDTPIRHFSSGMYMRLAFSMAAHLTSDVMVVDEVFGVGDSEFRSQCMEKMRQLSYEEGRTILFVSHDLGLLQSFCEQSLYLYQGQCRFYGPMEEGINFYRQELHLTDTTLVKAS